MKNERNKRLFPRARKLRNNMTKEENDLWFGFLKDYPVRILRQKVIGGFIVDFYCPQAKLVIEVDGFQHELDPEIKSYDENRTQYLTEQGIFVLRIKNAEINKANFANVCNKIDKLIKSRL